LHYSSWKLKSSEVLNLHWLNSHLPALAWGTLLALLGSFVEDLVLNRFHRLLSPPSLLLCNLALRRPKGMIGLQASEPGVPRSGSPASGYLSGAPEPTHPQSCSFGFAVAWGPGGVPWCQGCSLVPRLRTTTCPTASREQTVRVLRALSPYQVCTGDILQAPGLPLVGCWRWPRANKPGSTAGELRAAFCSASRGRKAWPVPRD